MRLKAAKCPSCGAVIKNLDPEMDGFFCMYCGSHIIDEGRRHYTIDKNININKTYRKIDEARLYEAGTKRAMEMNRISEENNKAKWGAIELLIGAILLIVLFGMMFFIPYLH